MPLHKKRKIKKRSCIAYAVIPEYLEDWAILPQYIWDYKRVQELKKNFIDEGIKSKIIKVKIEEV